MSLLSTASVWTNDDPPKKKQPTMNMRKTVKKMPEYLQNGGQPDPTQSSDSLSNQADEYVSEDQNYKGIKMNSIEETQTTQDNRNSRVNELLNKITTVNVENDGNSLANFNPISNPQINQKKGTLGNTENPVQPSIFQKNNTSVNYAPNNIDLAKLSNYRQSYEPPSTMQQPYYAKMGLGSGSHDSKIMDKINYMIHLLEEQANEKTSNITEEFILYTFLGVFVIFIVDSFARAGKYVR